jgi:hypothetical protein
MKRAFALLTGLAIVLGEACAHGVWTQRWAPSTDLTAAVARLAALPEEIDGWVAGPDWEDRQALLAAGAEGWWLRRFTHRRTGAVVHVVLLCGPSGQMCIHRPEHCYSGAGYELPQPPQRYSITATKDHSEASFWTAQFRKPEPGGAVNLRLFWGWLGTSGWQAPDHPRWSLAGEPYLYKLYVIREVPEQPSHLDDDPAATFLHAAVAALSPALHIPPR